MLGEWDSLGKGDQGRRLLGGQEERGEGALPPEPKLLPRRQTAYLLK